MGAILMESGFPHFICYQLYLQTPRSQPLQVFMREVGKMTSKGTFRVRGGKGKGGDNDKISTGPAGFDECQLVRQIER